jgi:hypothetical protein
MRVELYDEVMRVHTISSCNAETIGRWFAEHAQKLMTLNSAMPEARLRVWGETQHEYDLLHGLEPLGDGQGIECEITQDGLLYLADVILKASSRLAEMEDSGARA